MGTERRRLSFVLFGQPDGWGDKRVPVAPGAAGAFARHVAFARQAERATLDAYFKADFLGFDKDAIERDPSLIGEPLSIVSALATTTERLGLVTTASTSFFEPYNVARQVATLNAISGGRAGWNAVTSFNGEVNFGPSTLGSLPDRYERAHEFIDVVIRLWKSWDPDAVSFHDGARPTVDPSRIHEVRHAGKHFQVEQALDVSRLVPELPVVFQAGASDEGIRFAARHGEAVFVATTDIARGRAYSDRVKGLAAGYGRNPDSIRVLPGVRTYIGDTEATATEEYRSAYDDPAYYASRLRWISREAPAFDFDGLQLDEPIPAERIPSSEELARNPRRVSRGLLLLSILGELERPTLRTFLQRIHGHGHLDIVGTPEQVADTIGRWFAEGASDGFTLHGGNSFDRFTDEVIPLLRRRGIFREEYEGTTLRSHLGLDH